MVGWQGASLPLAVLLAFIDPADAFRCPRVRVNSNSGASTRATPPTCPNKQQQQLAGAGPLCTVPQGSGTGGATGPLQSSVLDSPSDVEVVPEVEDTPSAASVAVRQRSASDYKDELIDLVGGGMFASAGRKRTQVNELLLRLEASNPTRAPAYSPLLNGPWKFLYTGGISPGMLGLQLVGLLSSSASGAIELGDTQLTISRAQPRVEVSTSVRVFGRDQGFKIRTRLEVESEIRLKETYVEAETGSLRVPFPEQALFERRLFITYLDEDLLVVRDSFGAPDILIRKSKDFPGGAYGVPSATDDDAAPGAG